MKLTMMLADSAQAVNGKLYILGGGWSIVGPKPRPMAIVMKIEVPWDQANIEQRFRLRLIDQDARPVMVSTEKGERPVEISGTFTTGRAAHLPYGKPVGVPLAINHPPIKLEPGGSYVWELYINDDTREDWKLDFSVSASGRR